MYINPFLGGVLATLFCEFVIIFIAVMIRGGGDE